VTRRIVQLTDCHLFADPEREIRGTRTWPRFLAVLADIRKRVPDFDLLVFTGDTAHDEELATYEAVRRELGDWINRVRIIPGNHDNRAALRTVFPDSSGGLDGRVTFLARIDDWQLIGLDSQRPGELAGSLGAEQLDWLRIQLEATQGLNKLIFMHHPPVNVQSAWLDKIRLQDAAEFVDVLTDHVRADEAQLVGCGHVHQDLVAVLERSVTVFTTPAVGLQFRPRTAELEIEPGPPAYRVVDIAPGQHPALGSGLGAIVRVGFFQS